MTSQMLNQYLDGLMMVALGAFLTIIVVAGFVALIRFVWNFFKDWEG